MGGLLMQAETPARTGGWSGAFFSSTASTKWTYQTVAVEPASWYQFNAFVYHDDPWVESAFLRISWYGSADGSGSALVSVDSTTLLTSATPGFRLLTTGPTQAPPGAHSAKLRIMMRMMRPRDETSALLYIDDASFQTVSEPAFVPEQPGVEQSAGPRVVSSTRSSSRTASKPLAVVRPQPLREPMSAPVIRRHSLRAPEETATPHDGESPLWPWALFGAATGAGVVGWATYLAQRRKTAVVS